MLPCSRPCCCSGATAMRPPPLPSLRGRWGLHRRASTSPTATRSPSLTLPRGEGEEAQAFRGCRPLPIHGEGDPAEPRRSRVEGAAPSSKIRNAHTTAVITAPSVTPLRAVPPPRAWGGDETGVRFRPSRPFRPFRRCFPHVHPLRNRPMAVLRPA